MSTYHTSDWHVTDFKPEVLTLSNREAGKKQGRFKNSAILVQTAAAASAAAAAVSQIFTHYRKEINIIHRIWKEKFSNVS